MAVPNFHLRGIDPDLYERLRERAQANGRSVNAEILEIVREEVERDVDRARLLDELDRLRRMPLPPGVPPPEQLIREARDERSRRL